MSLALHKLRASRWLFACVVAAFALLISGESLHELLHAHSCDHEHRTCPLTRAVEQPQAISVAAVAPVLAVTSSPLLVVQHDSPDTLRVRSLGARAPPVLSAA